MNGLEALEEIESNYRKLKGNIEKDCFIHIHELLPFLVIKKELKALEIVKKAFSSSSIYVNKLKDSCECGWITQEEYDLLKEILQ